MLFVIKIILSKPIMPQEIFELSFKIKSPDAFNMKKKMGKVEIYLCFF